jgi:hypothetical protein
LGTSHRAHVGRPDLPGGYWIASADPIAAMHAVILTELAGLACLPHAGGRQADLLVPARGGHRGRRFVRHGQGEAGDVFYDGAAARADPMIDQWKRETAYEEKP